MNIGPSPAPIALLASLGRNESIEPAVNYTPRHTHWYAPLLATDSDRALHEGWEDRRMVRLGPDNGPATRSAQRAHPPKQVGTRKRLPP